MLTITSAVSLHLVRRVVWWAVAVLLLTTVHHVYGACVYDTPWRLHVAFVSSITVVVILGSAVALRRASDHLARIAFWIFAGVTLAVPVAAIGVFEGAYNHLLKDLLYFAGASRPLLTRLFPPPAYELPNDAFFEITGVLQVVPATAAAWFLYRLVRAGRPSLALPRRGQARG